jgi:uncharacterized protein YjdB
MDKEMHSIPSAAASPSATWRLPALLGVFIFSLLLWSCNTSSEDDIYTVTFKLDPSRVGKFDSVRVDIYNGAAPGPGDTATPVQTKVIALTPTTKEITLQLNAKVKKDFSVVVTGFTGKEITYRNLHEVDGFTSPDPGKPSILLISRIVAEDLTVNVGETRAPVLTITPENAVDKRILLFSADSLTVQVVGDSVKSLKGLKTGNTKVTATTADQSIKVEFTVNVVSVRVTKLQSDSLSLKVGDKVVPVVTVLPDNATDRDFTLESSNPEVLAVSGKGVEALKAGSVKLVLISADGGAKDTVAVSIRVAVTGLKGNDLVKEVGDRFAPVLEWTPADATDQGYTLTSSEPSKVSVDGDSLEAEAVGTAAITATSRDGKIAATFEVKVDTKVFRVKSVDGENIRMLVGDTVAAKVTFDPVNASDKGFTLATSDTGIVTLIDDRIAALAIGTAKVAVTSVDGGFKDTITVSVELSNFLQDIKPITSSKCAACHVPPSRLDWTDSTLLVRHGSSAIVRLKLPESDSLHMPLPGAIGGPITARELKVLLVWLGRVVVPLQSVSIADTTVNLGDTLSPAINFVPQNASNKLYSLSISDTSVAVVVGGGLVPIASGKATVTATIEEGNRKVTFVLTVKDPLFEKNVLPIISIKCAPCHLKGSSFNWQDSNALMSAGSEAIRRLNLAPNTPGRMPLATDGNPPPNGELTAQEMRVMLAWLHSKVVPLIGITAPNDSVMLGVAKLPNIIFSPANATTKTYELISTDSTKITTEDGKLFGKSIGSALVQVKALDGGFIKFFTVKVIPVPVDSIHAQDSAGAIGDTVIPEVDFFPPTATNKAYTIALLKASTKVKVDSAKKIIGLSLGKDTLEATSADGSKKSRFTFTVGPVLPKSMSVSDANGVAGGLKIAPVIVWTPSTTTNKAFTMAVTTGDTSKVAAIRGDSIQPKDSLGQITIKATSTADPTVTATFKFTVGPVSVQSIAVTTPIKVVIGSTVTPILSFTPINSTNKSYTLAIPALDAANLTLAGGGLSVTGVHLDTSVVVITTVDGSKKANWSVQVIRPPMGTARTLIHNRCSGCHYPNNPFGPIPAWSDGLTADSSLIVTGANAAKIIQRISVSKDMPMSGPLPQPEIDAIVGWLNNK